VEADNPVNDANPHISNIGKMVEVYVVKPLVQNLMHIYPFLGNGK